MDVRPDSKLTSDPAALRAADAWIFDLDNTLYPAACRLFDQVDVNITRYIMNFLDLDWDTARGLQKGYFRQHGTTMNGLMTLHDADPHEYLTFVHDIDLSPVDANPAMDAALAKLPGRKIVFTNGSVDHAEGVMGALGVAHHFEAIFDIVASDYRPKPEPAVYDKFVAVHDIDPARSVMIEDMAKNLKPAHALGMTCVWVRTESDWARDGHDEDHVHHVVDDLTGWLVEVAG